MFDDPPSGDRGHNLIRIPDPLPAAVAQRKGATASARSRGSAGVSVSASSGIDRR